MDKKRIEKMLSDLYYEFIAQSAWIAHAYAFEYMSDYYYQILDILRENNIPTDELEFAYKETVNEYNRIVNSDELSFLNPDDTEQLDTFDNAFLLMIYNMGELVSWLVGVDVGFDCLH